MTSYNFIPSRLLLSMVVLLTISKEAYSISVAAGTTEKEHELICRRTRDDKPGGRKNTTCVFPFKFDGITYDGVCTNEMDPNGEFWCSTETDKRGRHKPGGGHWGYCHDGCDKKPVIRRTVEEAREHCSVTLSEGGPKPDTKCVWPFKFNKKVYDGVCTNEGDPQGRFWCSTKTGKKGKWKDRHLKGGNWGYCQPGCNVEPVKDLLTRTTETSTERVSTKPTKRRRQQTKTKCKGIYCDKQFWDKNSAEIKNIEEKLGNWEDFNNETAVGNYLPNEKDLTCGSDTKHGYIIGGEDSKMGEFPFLAALGYRAKNDRIFYSCGATLINRRYVVTAAHCHDKEGPINKRIAEVVLGDYDLSKNPDCVETKNDGLQCTNKPVQRFNVQEDDITVHEGFDKNDVMSTANDIALVRLEKPAFTAAEIASGVHVLPICLPWGNLPNGYTAEYPSEANLKNTYVVMGWGRTNNKRADVGDRFSGGAHSNILQQLEVPLITNELCRSNYTAFQSITSNKQICAGGIEGKDSCQGDSGGPLIVREGEAGKMYLRGITSFGTNRCGFGYPGVYTDISYYSNWIKEHLKPYFIGDQLVSARNCSITVDGPRTNMPCIFPFMFAHKTFNTCTDEKDPGNFWCSTKVDEEGKHIGGANEWGYCADGCDDKEPTKIQSSTNKRVDCTVTVAGPNPNRKCVFPFKYGSKTYRSCTDISDPGRFWCSTKTDKNGRHVTKRKQWGYCHPSCGSLRTRIRKRKPPKPIIQTTEDVYDELENPDSAKPDFRPMPGNGTCGFSTSSGFIVGGENTIRGEIPFLAALGYKKPRRSKIKYKCGGALINRRYVITAAHCISDELVQVVLGDWKIDTDPDCDDGLCAKAQKFDISSENAIVHERWNRRKVTTDGNDIALIKLPYAAVTVNEKELHGNIVLPICIDWDHSGLPSDWELLVAGWGRNSSDHKDVGDFRRIGAHSNIMQKLIVPSVPMDECKSNFKFFRNIHSVRHLCAGGEIGKDSCSGDSGGPLITRKSKEEPMYLRGIVSFGAKRCGERGVPGVYINIFTYLKWIEQHLK